MKTVSFDDEAYRLLRGAKVTPRESFSDVVKRMLGRKPRLEDTCGAWSDFTEEEYERLKRERLEAFGTTLDEP